MSQKTNCEKVWFILLVFTYLLIPIGIVFGIIVTIWAINFKNNIL